MDNEMKYRIKVESINGNDEELRAKWRTGIDCNGFVIIEDDGDGYGVLMHGVSTMDIAQVIVKSDELTKAACVALGMIAGREITKMRMVKPIPIDINGFGGALGRLFDNKD